MRMRSSWVIILGILWTLGGVHTLRADERPLHRTSTSFHLGFDYLGNGTGSRFGITTPYVLSDTIAIRASYLTLGQPFETMLGTEVYYFKTLETSLIVSHRILDQLRGFLRLGIGLVLPDNDISNSVSMSWSPNFGMEYLVSRFGFSLEVGGFEALPGIARRVPKEPYYGRGIHAGLALNIYI